MHTPSSAVIASNAASGHTTTGNRRTDGESMGLTPLLRAVTASAGFGDLSCFPANGGAVEPRLNAAGALSKLAMDYQAPFEGTSMLRGGSPRGSEGGETEGTLAMLMADMQKVKEEAAQDPPAETGAEAAIRSLLDLRQGSVTAAPAPRAERRLSPSSGPLKRRGVADRASQFTCRHVGCGKAYGCPDAVRKHCRKAHQEWLRSLGHVGPAGYCSWETGL
jgi:hypothetical protein